MGKFNEYSQKATPEDADSLTDQCGHQQLADEQQDGGWST